MNQEEKEDFVPYEEMVAFLIKAEPIVKKYEAYKKALTEYLKQGNAVTGASLKTYRKASQKFVSELTPKDVANAFPDVNPNLYSKTVLLSLKDMPDFLRADIMSSHKDWVEETAPAVGVVVDSATKQE